MIRIPPNLLWPGLVIGLLLMSVSTSAAILFAARSDGGPQVVEDYYARAVDWDARQELLRKSRALGWATTVTLNPEAAAQARTATLAVADADGAPVTGLEGTVELRRPHLASATATVTLREDPSQPGTYSFEAPIGQPGLWDFALDLKRDELHFVHTLRQEIR